MDFRHYRFAWRYFKQHQFSQDDRRNMRLGGIVSAYGLSFAIEKLLLGIGNPIPDIWWFVIYGSFALLSTFWWLEDSILDLWERHTTEDDDLYRTRR